MKFSNIIKSTVVVSVAVLMVSGQALAQSKTLVVDYDKVLNQSKAGKSAGAQFKSIAKTIQNEIDAQVKKLEREGKKVQASTQAIKTKAQLDARPDIAQQYKTFKQNEQKTAMEYQYKGAEMKKTQADTLMKIRKKMNTIISAVGRERGADMIVDARSVYYYNPSIDITATVMSRLDSQMPSVVVTRARLPRQAPKGK